MKRTFSLRGIDPWGSIWRFFCSVRLALILILLIAVALLAGALVIQAPEGVRSDPVDYRQWLQGLRGKYGAWTDILSTLQVFDIFGSVWFRLLLGTLAVNITVCVVNRWGGIWHSVTFKKATMGPGFFRTGSYRASFESRGLDHSRVVEQVKEQLKRRRYRVLEEAQGEVQHIYADVHRFGKLGTLATHGSLVLVLVGALTTGFLGFRDSGFVVAEGSTRDVAHGTGLSLYVDSFIEEWYPNNTPKDYYTDAVILKDGQEVSRGRIRVNTPLQYDGVRFHQAFYGEAAVMRVEGESGAVLFDEGVPLQFRSAGEERPIGILEIPEENLVVGVIAPYGPGDPLIASGQVRLEAYRGSTEGSPLLMVNVNQGQAQKIAGLSFTFLREKRFTGLQVVQDPGGWVIWTACTLLVLGLMVTFYFPYHRVWARVEPGADGVRVQMKAVVGKEARFAVEFEQLSRDLRTALQGGSRSPVGARGSSGS